MFTSFIGRQREIAEISQLLASAHLVTLVGGGGRGEDGAELRGIAGLHFRQMRDRIDGSQGLLHLVFDKHASSANN